jgi:acyl-CoA synthetase (NDP forming)
LLAPRSVAVVGATDREGSYGAQALVNLTEIGFPGPVWGVNPGRDEVLGRPCVASLADLPEPADAVIVAIPAAGVAAAIDQAGGARLRRRGRVQRGLRGGRLGRRIRS